MDHQTLLIQAAEYKRSLREAQSAFLAVRPNKKTGSYLSKTVGKIVNIMQSFDIVATQSDVDEFNKLNPVREGQLKLGGFLPKLSPHDFRRTFAVFFRRYNFGTVASIKFQYKHENINMSDYYANNARLQAMSDIMLDKELLTILHDEGVNLGVDIFNEIYNESSFLSGMGGERITQDKFDKLKSGHNIYMNREEIEKLVKNGTLSVVKLPTGGYCMNATCSRVCGIGQFSAEITPCTHQVITDNEAKTILRQNNRLVKSFKELNNGDPFMKSILIGMKQKIKRNEITIKQHQLKFEEFNDSIQGVILMGEV